MWAALQTLIPPGTENTETAQTERSFHLQEHTYCACPPEMGLCPQRPLPATAGTENSALGHRCSHGPLAWLTQAVICCLLEGLEVWGHTGTGKLGAVGTAGGSHLEWLLQWHMEP